MYSKTRPESSRIIIARNVKALREHRGLSQAELGRKAGISQRTISNIENPDADTTPTTDRVEAVAVVFGLTLYQIAMPLPLEILVDMGKMAGVVGLIDNYAHADADERETVERIARMAAATHRPLLPPPNINQANSIS